ncbi:MAG: hypothetical protein AAB613_00990 [Patescibacteria group bacterium]
MPRIRNLGKLELVSFRQEIDDDRNEITEIELIVDWPNKTTSGKDEPAFFVKPCGQVSYTVGRQEQLVATHKFLQSFSAKEYLLLRELAAHYDDEIMVCDSEISGEVVIELEVKERVLNPVSFVESLARKMSKWWREIKAMPIS